MRRTRWNLCVCLVLSWATLLLLTRSVCAATIAHWRFEDNLLDETANDNDATATGTMFSSDVFGTPVPATGAANTRSLQINNSSGGLASATDFLTVPHDNSLNIATGSFTIEAWVKLDQFGSRSDRQYVVHKKDLGQLDEASSFIFLARAGSLLPDSQDRGVLALALHDGVADNPPDALENYVFSSLAIGDNTNWHHISVAVDRSTGNVRFTLDDQVELLPGAASGPLFSGQNNNDALFIGAHPTGNAANPPNEGFDGFIDELRISNTFLDTSELLPVPEPMSVVSAIAGIALLLAWRLCQRRR